MIRRVLEALARWAGAGAPPPVAVAAPEPPEARPALARLASKDPRERTGAARALVALGDPVVPLLQAALRDPATPAAARLQSPGVLREIATPAAYAALLWSLGIPDRAARTRVIQAASAVRALLRKPPEKPHLIRPRLEAEAREHYEMRANAERLAAAFPAPPLVRAAGEEARRALVRMLRLLELRHDRDAVAGAASEVLSDDESGDRRRAAQALARQLDAEERALVLPALEEGGVLAVLPRVPIEVRVLEPDEWLAVLLESGEPWLRACALDAITRGKRRAAAVKALLLARDPDPVVRESLIGVIRALAPEGARAAVEALAHDPDPQVREAAAAAA